MAAASTFEQWGRTYGEEWAFRASMRLQPGRTTAAEKLSILLALDGQAGDTAAAEEARRLAADTVASRPWDPNVRPTAADVETLLKEFDAARAWIRRQLARFPADLASFPPGAGSSATGVEAPENPFPAPT